MQETQITAKYYAPGQMAAQTSGRCDIINSQGQEFLSFRMVEDFGADLTVVVSNNRCLKRRNQSQVILLSGTSSILDRSRMKSALYFVQASSKKRFTKKLF